MISKFSYECCGVHIQGSQIMGDIGKSDVDGHLSRENNTPGQMYPLTVGHDGAVIAYNIPGTIDFISGCNTIQLKNTNIGYKQ